MLPKLRKLKKLIMVYSGLADRPWEEIAMHLVEETTVELIFSRVQSLEFLYVGGKKIDGGRGYSGRGFRYMKWVRESVIQGEMAPKEEVLIYTLTDV